MGKVNLNVKEATINDGTRFVIECYQEAQKIAGFSEESPIDGCLDLPKIPQKGSFWDYSRKFITLPSKVISLREDGDACSNEVTP